MKKYLCSDYFNPPQRIAKVIKRYYKYCDSEENDKAQNVQGELAQQIGIIYTTHVKKVSGVEIEVPVTEFDEVVFVSFLHQSFSVICIADNVAMYNYKEHRYIFVPQNEYLSFFKTILDELDGAVWNIKREKAYAVRFFRDIGTRLSKWEAPSGKIVFTNGTLDIFTDEFSYGDNPSVINFHCTGYEFLGLDTEIKCPKFLNFIESVSGEVSLTSVIQEQYGSTFLYGNNPIQRIYLYIGAGRNGKGVCLNILISLHGIDNVATASVEQIASRFGAAMIYDKALNISSENDIDFAVNTALLKAVSGNDFITVENKFQKAFQAKVFCKLIISSNEITFKDRSRGFEERLLPIPFDYTFVDNPRPDSNERKRIYNLEEELREEIPHIFLWAYQGLKRLMANNWQFTKCKRVDELRNMIIKDANPVLQFFDDCITPVPGEKAKKPEVYECFNTWVSANGIRTGTIVSAHKFYEEFERILESKGYSRSTKRIQGYNYYKDIKIT